MQRPVAWLFVVPAGQAAAMGILALPRGLATTGALRWGGDPLRLAVVLAGLAVGGTLLTPAVRGGAALGVTVGLSVPGGAAAS